MQLPPQSIQMVCTRGGVPVTGVLPAIPQGPTLIHPEPQVVDPRFNFSIVPATIRMPATCYPPDHTGTVYEDMYYMGFKSPQARQNASDHGCYDLAAKRLGQVAFDPTTKILEPDHALFLHKVPGIEFFTDIKDAFYWVEKNHNTENMYRIFVMQSKTNIKMDVNWVPMLPSHIPRSAIPTTDFNFATLHWVNSPAGTPTSINWRWEWVNNGHSDTRFVTPALPPIPFNFYGVVEILPENEAVAPALPNVPWPERGRKSR